MSSNSARAKSETKKKVKGKKEEELKEEELNEPPESGLYLAEKEGEEKSDVIVGK